MRLQILLLLFFSALCGAMHDISLVNSPFVQEIFTEVSLSFIRRRLEVLKHITLITHPSHISSCFTHITFGVYSSGTDWKAMWAPELLSAFEAWNHLYSEVATKHAIFRKNVLARSPEARSEEVATFTCSAGECKTLIFACRFDGGVLNCISCVYISNARIVWTSSCFHYRVCSNMPSYLFFFVPRCLCAKTQSCARVATLSLG